jgi:sodium-coupled neutral amino acid transporter 10
VNEAALNLANCIMGAGALALPSFFKSCGVILGVLVLLLSGAWTWVSCEMMLRTADAVSHRFLRGKPVGSYEDLVALTLGWRGRVVTTAGIVLLQIGCLVVSSFLFLFSYGQCE